MKKLIVSAILCGLGLFGFMAASPGADFVTILQEKLKAFYQSRNRMRIQLVLNQPEYAAGDTVYYKVHLLQSHDLKPVFNRSIVNLELIDKDRRVLIHSRIASTEGAGAGQLILPSKIGAGSYLLIAYADAVTGSYPESIYQREVRIAGDKQLDWKESEMSVFAEGGHLILGVRTKVITRIPGNDMPAKVVDGSGRIVAEFTTRSGLGTFTLEPIAGERYVVETAFMKKDLPDAQPDGVGIAVSQNQGAKQFRVAVTAPEISNWRKQNLFVVLSSRGTICFSKSVQLQKEPVALVNVPNGDCQEGIAQLTVFGEAGEVLAERLVFIEPTPVDIQIKLDAPMYQVRKPISAGISIKDFRGLSIGANLSVTVFKEDLFPNSMRMPSFRESVLLHSDLSPSFVSFPELEKMDANELSDYLITRRWGGFTWPEVMEAPKEKVSSARTVPYYFKGHVFFRNSDKAVPDSTAITFYLNRNDFVYMVYTRKNGEFEFPLFMDFNSDELFYAIHYKGKVLRDAFISTPGTPPVSWPFTPSVFGSAADPYGAFAKIKRPIVESFQYYASKKESGIGKAVAENEYAEFDDVDVVADVGKYKKFNSVSEMLLEIVPAVKNKRVDNEDAVRVFLRESAMFAADDPLYFIDGVITDSTAYFLSLNPDQIVRIKVMRSEKTLSRFGDLGKNGIVIIETSSPEKNRPTFESKRILHITGVATALPFSARDYRASANSNIPDLRTTLYWNPKVAVDKSGEVAFSFYTGDATGSFLIRVEGLTDDGHPFSKYAHFTVALDRP